MTEGPESLAQLARRSVGAALTQPSTQSLPDAEYAALVTMVDQLRRGYPHQDLADSLETLTRGYELVATEYGLAAVEEALLIRYTRQKFFPHPSELREELESMKASERKAILAANPFRPCGLCEGGFVRVNADGTPFRGGSPAKTRLEECTCRVEWRRRVRGEVQPTITAAEAYRRRRRDLFA